MALNARTTEALTFDAFGTLVDVHTAEEKLSEYVDNPGRISELWRFRVLAYRPLCNFIEYRSHHEINKDALRFVFENQNIDVGSEALEEIASVYHEMEPFDDVYESMQALHEEGYDLYILSNGDPELLSSVVEAAELQDFITDLISADEINTYKPSPEIYSHAIDRVQPPRNGVAHVAGEWADVLGGVNAGMKGIWLNRGGRPMGLRPSGQTPDLIAETFEDITEELT